MFGLGFIKKNLKLRFPQFFFQRKLESIKSLEIEYFRKSSLIQGKFQFEIFFVKPIPDHIR